MSDFLQFEDEVIDGTPEYELEQKPNGKYNITLSNEVVHSGTPLSKSGLNRLNAILGYNIPSLTKTPIQTTINVSPKLTSSGNVDYLNTNNSNYTFHSNYSLFRDNDSNSVWVFGTAKTYKIWMNDANTIIKKMTMYSPYTSGTYTIYGSNSLSETPVQFDSFTASSSNRTHQIDNTNNYKYLSFTNNQSNGFQMFTSYVVELLDTGTNNDLSFDFEISDVDKSIIKTTLIDNDTSVVANTLNGKKIDTLLLNEHYYELMYDEVNDRFIAHEERV